MALFVLGDLAVKVDAVCPTHGLGLTSLLHELAFVPAEHADVPEPAVVLTVHMHNPAVAVSRGLRHLAERDGLTLYQCGDDTCVGDGSSLLRLCSRTGTGEAWLTSAFLQQPRLRRQRFWGYGLTKLLRARGAYALHAAGVRTPQGQTMLLIGPSGSGKSTLALGLVRHGWGYLSDDAVLLRRRGSRVDAIGFRRAFSVCRTQRKYRMDVRAAYPQQHIETASPELLVFPSVARRPRSGMRRVTATDALGRLLRQGGPELYDRSTMGDHLALLASLLQQAPAYTLRAGGDLYTRPALLLRVIRHADGACHGPDRS